MRIVECKVGMRVKVVKVAKKANGFDLRKEEIDQAVDSLGMIGRIIEVEPEDLFPVMVKFPKTESDLSFKPVELAKVGK